MSGAIPKTKFVDKKVSSGSRSVTKGAKSQDHLGAEEGEEFPPLERRIIEYKSENAVITRTPALSKQWAPRPSTEWVEFYLPKPDSSEKELSVWAQWMELFQEDLQWLLKLSHHQFWSSLVHCPQISSQLLSSFLKYAPRFYDKNYAFYERHSTIWPIYKEIYVLIFKIYMRIATYKESKEDHISSSFWCGLLHDHKLISFSTLSSLSTLYESKENPLFSKMVENLLRNDSRLIGEMRAGIPLLISKFAELSEEIEALLCHSAVSDSWAPEKFEQILWFKLDGIYSLYKFLKAYPPASKILLHYPNFISSMAGSYEANARRWGKIIVHMPNLEDRVALCRAAILRLFRTVLANSTIHLVESANDKRLDEFFDYFSNCIDEKIFIHDYEKSFPFKTDMQGLLSRGIFVDETRIDYMANAISSCFHSCGEEYSVEKIVVDPLYDPNFDRQLLGACSLEVIGVELQSLITQVKDLLPELPNSYIEAVLKHYSYSAETTINALLEGSVPSRLEKYKSEEYIKSRSTQSLATEVALPQEDKLPVTFPAGGGDSGGFITANNKIQDKSVGEFSYTEFARLAVQKEIKEKILQSVQASENDSGPKPPSSRNREMDDGSSYVDESLLPKFNMNYEYDDEYDDTYDDVGAGMTEPDNNLFNPLNKRKIELQPDNRGGDQEEEEEESGRRKFDAFCEDPAIVRERFERRRQEIHSRRGGGGGGHSQPPQNQPSGAQQRDVVGRAKGQGQEKDVVYNRRQKTANKGAGGSYKKRSDFKRREF